MKRVITALLAALLVLSLAACGSGVETKKLAGTWTCTIDVTDRMNAADLADMEACLLAAEQALGLSAADGAAKMPLQLVLTVTEDGAYTLRYDSDAARTALDAYATALHPAAVESVYAAAEEQGLSREEYDAAMEKAGITMDDMVAAIFAGVDEEELLSLLTGRSAAITGYCRAESGQLYLADTAAELAETADCLSYTLSDGTMTWTDAQGELSSQLTEQEQELLRVPLTWTKQEESK